MRLNITQFLKNYSVREYAKLQSPKLHALNKLDLPFESIYQFFDGNNAVMGPSQTDPLFSKHQGKVYIEHVTDMLTFEGNPRRTSNIPATMIQEFRRQNRFFKPLRSDTGFKLSNQNILVMNYNLINPQWNYMASYKATWFRWSNDMRTFWSGVAAACERFPGWNQFIDVHLPELVPPPSSFNKLRGGLTQDLANQFNTPDILNIFDLVRWVSDDRESSFMNVIDAKYYGNINLLFRVQSSFFVINLGMLDQWRRDPEIKDDKGYDTQQIARRLISLVSAMVEYNQGNTSLIKEDTPIFNEDIIVDEETPVSYEEGEAEEVEDVESNNVEEEVTEVDVIDDVQFDPTNLTNLIDIGAIEVTYTPPPESDLEVTKLIIEKDPLESSPSRQIKEEKELIVTDVPEDELFINTEVDEEDKLIDAIRAKAYDMYRVNMISANTFEQAQEDSIMYRRLPDPFTDPNDESVEPMTIAEAMEYHPDDLKIPEDTTFEDKPTIVDKSMLGSKLKAIQRKYNKVLLKKDILNSVLSVQKQGVSVTNYKIETVRDSGNHYQIHKVTLKPIRGRSSQVMFRIPVIDNDGRFMSNGVTYRQRLQRADIPIRKVNPRKVALTSYYNKTFVTRSERAENNFDNWLIRAITNRALDGSDMSVHSVTYAELDQSNYVLPRVYTTLGTAFKGFHNHRNVFYFNFKDRNEFFAKQGLHIEDYETDDLIMVGFNGTDAILLDKNSIFYMKTGNELEPIGTITDILGLDLTKAPLEAILMSIGGKELPLGFILAYHHGLNNLLKKLNVNYQRHQRGTRIVVNSTDYTLAFADEILVFDRADYKAMLVLSGLKRYHKSLRRYSVYDFNKRDVYFRVLEEAGLSNRFTRDIDTLFSAWVDPITEGLLKEMGEPTTFEGLLYRSVELLTNDWSPAEVDGAYMRYRGYERMAGAIFNELNRAVRVFNMRNGGSVQTVELDPHVIWRKIVQDPTVATIEDSNPIANIREQEAMTYRGDGGRGSTSMVARTRIYGEADVGVVSESTVDSGDVGVIAYLVPDANFVNMRGVTRMFDPKTDGPARLLSTSALLGVATEHDDPKRINFISIQQQQGIYADGYTVTPVRTGYEQIIAQRTSSIFAVAAEQDGEVVAIDEYGIQVKYADGNVFGYQLGTVHGTAAGVNYPHILVTSLKKGDKFKRGDTITYNKRYFSEDRYTPGQVLWKAGCMAVVAFDDNLDTLEDGSVISEDLAKRLNTQTTAIKNIDVRFDQTIRDMVKVGDHVDLNSILCIIEDPETAAHSLYDEASIETLRKLSAYSPRAKLVGTVSKIECFYHGEIDDMTPSLQALANTSDKQRAERAKSLKEPTFTGQVDANYRVKGRALEYDHMIIRVYIDHDIPCGVGDKGVVANQMKTVFSRVMTGRNETEDGRNIDLLFGNTSVEERMVLSPKIIATTTGILWAAGKHLVAVYRGNTNAKAK
ncbi:RNA polymerase beta subunit [Pseudomonas phage vB_Pae10145-KEN51]